MASLGLAASLGAIGRPIAVARGGLAQRVRLGRGDMPLVRGLCLASSRHSNALIHLARSSLTWMVILVPSYAARQYSSI